MSSRTGGRPSLLRLGVGSGTPDCRIALNSRAAPSVHAVTISGRAARSARASSLQACRSKPRSMLSRGPRSATMSLYSSSMILDRWARTSRVARRTGQPPAGHLITRVRIPGSSIARHTMRALFARRLPSPDPLYQITGRTQRLMRLPENPMHSKFLTSRY